MQMILVFLLICSLCSIGSININWHGHEQLTSEFLLDRHKRQLPCIIDYQCTSGECISRFNLCDGRKDCSDGSDETERLCKNVSCGVDTFTCAYGACVDSEAKCNSIQECADNSDELDCKSPTTPRVPVTTIQIDFQCTSGEYIRRYNLCDGRKDCSDGSDETERLCKNVSCRVDTFICAYGACVDSEAKCNGIQECVDNSDELDCKSPTTPRVPVTTIENGCVLPQKPQNGDYTFLDGRKITPGAVVKINFVIKFTCKNNYKLIGNELLFCQQDKTWSYDIPTCLPTCQPLISTTLDMSCNWKGNIVSCESEMVNETIAQYRCKDLYEWQQAVNLPVLEVRCNNGKWSDKLVSCVPVCGRKTGRGVAFIISPNRNITAKMHEYPWHIALYLRKPKPTYICGGSIINSKLIVTAAHCFDKTVQKDNYIVSAGRFFSTYDHAGNEHVQNKVVDDIKFPARYLGLTNNYANNIAIIVLKESFTFNIFISPVCVDRSNFLYPMEPHETGYVAGWGFTSEGGTISEELNHIQLPYIPYNECITKVPNEFIQFIVQDAFCAGYTNGTGACTGDSGGGFTREIALPNGEIRHYLTGLLSIGPSKENNCDPNLYTVYTNISQHIEFIKEIEASYRDV